MQVKNSINKILINNGERLEKFSIFNAAMILALNPIMLDLLVESKNFVSNHITVNHTDGRTVDQIYADIDKAIINTPNFEKAMNNEITDINERKAFLNDLVKRMSDAGNINADKVMYWNIGDDSDGYYIGYTGKFISLDIGRIILDKEDLEAKDFSQIVITAMHEIDHAIISQKLVRSEHATRLDRILQSSYSNTSPSNYYASFSESLVYIRNVRRVEMLNEYFEPTTPWKPDNKLGKIIKEIKYDLYDVEYVSKVKTNNFKPVSLTDEFHDDILGVELMSLDEYYKAGMIEKLKELGYDLDKDYTMEELENTMHYKEFKKVMRRELLEVRVRDYNNGLFNDVIEDVDQDILDFYADLPSLSDAAVGYKIASYYNAIKYTEDFGHYSNVELGMLREAIIQHINKVDEQYINKYGLQELKDNINKQYYTDTQVDDLSH